MLKKLFIPTLITLSVLFGQDKKLSKLEYYNKHIAGSKPSRHVGKALSFQDRKRSVLDKGNLVMRMSNAAIYGYDPWGLNHEFPAGTMLMNGCCTYQWTAGPIVGALQGGVPSVSVGTKYSARDHDEEFEPLPGYDAGYVDTDANIG
ncbi:uncharacterized protein METZ01_LOCUS372313, partial [marine metagenome]